MYDPLAFFFFHIDEKSSELLEELKKWAINDPVVSQRCNHAIMPNSWNVMWGEATIVFAQLDAFFQLYHLIDFEYVINLSSDHYPLKSTKAIYHELQKNPDKSLIDAWADYDMDRLQNVIIPVHGEWAFFLHNRAWPFLK